MDENNNCYPFAKFNNNKWEVVENTPFIEMKTFRSNQKLVTIPFNQFMKIITMQLLNLTWKRGSVKNFGDLNF